MHSRGFRDGSDYYPLRIEAQQRRRILIFAAALFAVVLVIAGIVFAYDRSDKPDLVDASETTTSTTRVFDVPGVFVSTTTVPASPGPTTTTTRPRRTTTTAAAPQTEFPDAPAELVCATTTTAAATPAPDDWADYWTSEPDENEGLELKICVEDSTPKIGATVKLYVLARDKDAHIGSGPCDVFARWDSNDSDPDCPQRDTVYAPPANPKPTPTAKEGRVRLTFVHQFADPGESVIEVRAWSPPETEDRHPYASYNSIELRVNVHR